jgi:hypothetical protein
MALEAGRHYGSFREFYPDYLAEHSKPTTRRLHVLGLMLAIVVIVVTILLGKWWLLIVAPVVGYGLSWIGHFFFERNRPATFKHPLYSLMGDLVMFKDVITGKLR